MGFMDKIKNILFEEETVEIPIIKEEKAPKKEEKEEVRDTEVKTRFKGLNRDIEYNKREENNQPVNSVKKEEVIEKKEEKSPFISFDEDEFEMITSYREKKNYDDKRVEKKIDRDNYKNYKENNRKIDYYSNSRKVVEQKKKFKPSLVISPVYGVLDKNYKKDDVLPTASSDGTLPKIMDVDSVRRKAFGTLEDEIENNLKLNNTKEYKIVDEHKTIGELIEENLNDTEDVPHYKTEEIKITSYMDNEESDEDNTTLDDLIEKEKVEEVKVDEDSSSNDNDILEDIKIDNKEEKDDSTLESDLFDLIDSMYENREEEEK